jgi:hypothetical protein
MMRILLVPALAIVVLALGACGRSATSANPDAAAASPFSVVEASIADMHQALAAGRVS